MNVIQEAREEAGKRERERGKSSQIHDTEVKYMLNSLIKVNPG